MTASDKRVSMGSVGTSAAELFGKIDGCGFSAVELWGAEDFDVCLRERCIDPWERLRYIREYIKETKLMLTFRGQCLLGNRVFPDDVVEYFISRAKNNGIDVFRAYDAMNDPQNIESSASAVKHFGGELHVAMVYDGCAVQGCSFFAGYAARIEQMGADCIWLIDPNGLLTIDTVSELTKAVRAAVALPLMLSTSASGEVVEAALEAGADGFEYFADSDGPDLVSWNWNDKRRETIRRYFSVSSMRASDRELPADIVSEMRKICAEAGHPALISPISEIIEAQARLNLKNGRYVKMLPELCALLRGMYGRTPSSISDSFLHEIIGDAPILLGRPADKLEPELCTLRAYIAPYMEDVDDILTYAVAGADAIDFFELRKAKKYHLDPLRADSSLGVHVI